MSKPRILLVDDEPRFRKTLAKRLKDRGNSIVTVSSGEEAVEEIMHNEFDVVILDVRMPGLNGLETLVLLKRKRPELEVILLTGHDSMEYSREGIRLGAFDYVLKPCALDNLLDIVEQAFEKKISEAG